MIDWSDIRKQFPVTSHSVYLNTAAAGPLAISTQQAATQYYQQMMNDGDVHWDDWLAKREQVRARVARFINAEPDEIGFTTNTSSGMNLIIDSLEKHGEVISNDLEFPVTTIPWMHRRIPVHIVKAIGGVVTAGAISGDGCLPESLRRVTCSIQMASEQIWKSWAQRKANILWWLMLARRRAPSRLTSSE